VSLRSRIALLILVLFLAGMLAELVRTDSLTHLATLSDFTKADLLSRIGWLLLLNIVIYLMLGRWLQPIDHIVEALHEIEKGDFSKRIALVGMRELDQISSNINHLTEVLGASKADNERLQSESISKGERERLRLARELHDSLGQSIAAIKAVSVSIGMRTREQMPEIADSAHHIEKISDTAYASVRNLMSSLRPSVLDELGLTSGLQQMVDDWNIHHESTFCRLRIDCALDTLDGEQAINVYRIVQESLNNIAKYAQATDAGISVSGNEVLTLAIEDNGIGFDPDTVKKGMGLWNIQDRVNLLKGKFQLVSSPGNGLRLSMEIPREINQRKRST
jgi:two-component system, NarL family, sensor histidine kinase UhpB